MTCEQIAASVCDDMPGRPLGDKLAEAIKRSHGMLDAKRLLIALSKEHARLRAVK